MFTTARRQALALCRTFNECWYLQKPSAKSEDSGAVEWASLKVRAGGEPNEKVAMVENVRRNRRQTQSNGGTQGSRRCERLSLRLRGRARRREREWLEYFVVFLKTTLFFWGKGWVTSRYYTFTHFCKKKIRLHFTSSSLHLCLRVVLQ